MNLSKRNLGPWFLLALLLLLAWTSFQIVSVFIDYVAVALFLAYLTYPVYEWILKYVRKPTIAALVALIIIAATVLVPLGFLIAELVQEMGAIVASLNVANLEATLQLFENRLNEALGREPRPVGGDSSILASVVPTLNQFATEATRSLIQVLAEGFIGIFVLLYVQYYLYLDGPRLIKWFHAILPMHEAHRDLLFREVGLVVKAVMYGQVLTALIQAMIASVGFILFGVPNVVFWSVVTFILALLPIIGPPLVWAPWGIYLILTGNTFNGVGLLLYSAILVSTIDNIIRPKLIGSRAQVHPVVVLLGVLGGLALFGFSGFILGPLALSIFVTTLEVYRKEFADAAED